MGKKEKRLSFEFLDDKRHNKLLEGKSIQKFTMNKILAVKQRDGVQIFFDSK